MSLDDEFFRIANLPPYQLGGLADSIRAIREHGEDVLDLSQFNPSLEPPPVAVEKLVQASLQPHNHRYSASQGITILREAFCHYYQQRFGVQLCSQSEAVVTFGTKEGLAHLLLACVSPGETIILPTPSYPVHVAAVFIAGGSRVGVPLFSESEVTTGGSLEMEFSQEAFVERLKTLLRHTWPRPKILLLSFPHNPTTAIVSEGDNGKNFWRRIVEFAKEEDLLLVNDFAYGDLCFGKYQAPSLLAVDGAKDIAVEFYSLSKGFSLPGWRVGVCVGNPRLVSALKKIKSYLDCGVFQPLQIAAARTLKLAAENNREFFADTLNEYQARRDLLEQGLSKLGLGIHPTKASAFIWAKLPDAFHSRGSIAFSRKLLEDKRVAVCPGGAFDGEWNHYLRFSLAEPESRIRVCLERMAAFQREAA